MSAAPLLDTHAWIWWVDHDPRLGKRCLDALDSLPHEDRPALCDISLWEVATLVERGRLRFNLPFADWLEAAAHPRTVRIIPVTPSFAAGIADLPAAFHRDPADRIIVATSRALGLPLVTMDRLITRSRLVSLWKPPR